MGIKENGIILIPIDFSSQSLIAIKNSYNLGRFTKSKLHLFHVYSRPEEENTERLENLAQQSSLESGLVCEFSSKKGNIFEETVKTAKALNSDLIVAGLEPNAKAGVSGNKGSVSSFIKNSPCQILTVRSLNYSPECKNIVMPFDLSSESREKVSTVIQIARYFKADIRIVSVFDPNDTKYENKLLPYLHQVKKYIKEKDVKCTNKSIPSKNTVEAIIDYANKNNSELIVQMNKKDLSFSEYFGRTISQKIVDTSNIPVLTINPMQRVSMSHFGSGM